MNKKLKQPISLSIGIEESTLLQKLNDLGIKNIEVFRRGLKVYAEDNVSKLMQNNIA